MVSESQSDPESDENIQESSSDEQQNVSPGGPHEVNEYEKQRLERIKENKARLEALGIPSLASSFMKNVVKKKEKKKGKTKVDEDEEYRPSDGEQNATCSSEEECEDDESNGTPNSFRKGKMKQFSNTRRKKIPVQKGARKLEFIDEDEALQQAIALSLEGSSQISSSILREPPQICRSNLVDVKLKERKERALLQETDKQTKRRKSNTSRVHITEDQVIIHFFQFDVAGKGGITVKDLERVALDHDFPWTDKELADMIHLFDNDGNGRLNLDDFRKILNQCNMIIG